MLEMDGMIGTLELVAKSDWCAILPAALCDLDLSGDFRTLSPLMSPPLTTDYVIITSASKAPSGHFCNPCLACSSFAIPKYNIS